MRVETSNKEMRMNLNDKGYICKLVLDNSWFDCRYDESTGYTEVRFCHPVYDTNSMSAWKSLQDSHLSILEMLITQHCRVSKRLRVSNLCAAIENKAYINRYNSLKNYIESVEWDGVDRVEGALHTYMLAHGDTHDNIRRASKNFFISLIARAYDPGCNVGTMLVLEGDQGCGKTSFLSIIGDKWHTESFAFPKERDLPYLLRQSWIVELHDFSSRRKSGLFADSTPKFLLKGVDAYLPYYGRYFVTQPRQCVFAMTVNDRKVVKDPYNYFDYQVVNVRYIHRGLLEQDVGQLLAEALVMYRNKQ
jgi:putative DNA primase/helicase